VGEKRDEGCGVWDATYFGLERGWPTLSRDSFCCRIAVAVWRFDAGSLADCFCDDDATVSFPFSGRVPSSNQHEVHSFLAG